MEARAPGALKDILVGIIIGMTSMLPGISGATMCVVFNVYERIVRDVAKIHRYIVEDFKFLFLLIVGAVIGLVVCAKFLDNILDSYPVEALMFFIGLIAGQFFPLYNGVKEDAKGNYQRRDLAVFGIGICIMLVMIVIDIIGDGGDVVIRHDGMGIVLTLLIGVIVAVSALLPGLSHSTILLVAGLMEAFTAIIADLDFFLLIPMALGLVGGAVGFSKIIHKALKHHHFTTMMFILGLTAGSVLVIAWTVIGEIDNVWDVAGGFVCMVVGFFISIWSMKLDKTLGTN